MKQTKHATAAVFVALLCAAPNAVAQTIARSEDLHELHGGWSATEIIGARVRSSDGEEVGEIEDLILSSDDRVVTAIVSVGGLLDIADKLVAVPYRELRIAPDKKTLAIPLTTADIEAAPSYNGRSPATGRGHPIVDPLQAAPPDAAVRREADEEAARAFAGEDPRVGEGIAENKKAYEHEEAQREP